VSASFPTSGPPAAKPTIRDVAERAGVSKSLVSLVLQGSGNVSDARRRAVLEAMDELGYRPNKLARGLSMPRTGTVGVLLNDLRNPWFIELLEGLSASLHAAGVSPVLADSYTDRRIGRQSVEALLEQRIDGLVVNDDAAGARKATEHLIALGHKRIAHLQGPDEIGRLRRGGYEQAMQAAGLEPHTVAGGMSEESGYSAARALLAADAPPTAIFAFNDIACIGVLSAAADAGVTVPGDISLVGYDNTYLARIRHLSLTSVDNGNLAVGVQAGRYILERLGNPDLPGRKHLVSSELQVRGSSGSAPDTGGA
jgi:DNA-binding LacI/PurR family transcriptional regulator